MIGIIGKSEVDGDWSWKDQYNAPTLFTSEVAQETFIQKMGDIPASLSQSTREKLMDALCEYPLIRLSPIKR